MTQSVHYLLKENSEPSHLNRVDRFDWLELVAHGPNANVTITTSRGDRVGVEERGQGGDPVRVAIHSVDTVALHYHCWKEKSLILARCRDNS